MTQRFNLYASGIGIIAIVLVAGLLQWTLQDPLATMVNAQQNGPPIERPDRKVVEVGAERGAVGGIYSLLMVGRRTTHADGRVEHTVRFSFAGDAVVLTAGDVSDFVEFARKVDEKRKDLQPQPPAKQVSIRWVCKDIDGQAFELQCSAANGIWVVFGFEQEDFIDGCEQVLKDIEGIKANKARVPW